MALSVNGGFGSKGGGSNPNLLDNSWFTVNQRGSTSYPDAPTSYSVDRWRRHANVSMTVDTDGISITASEVNGISQIFEKQMKIGDVVTVSVLLQNGTLYTGSAVLGDNGATSVIENDLFKVNVRLSAFYLDSKFLNSVLSIHAIKLEYGSTSTLALDSAPNYTTELLKCQRYFYRCIDSGFAYQPIGTGVITASNMARIIVKYPTTMRTKPTYINVGGLANIIVIAGSNFTPTAIALDDAGTMATELRVTISGGVAGQGAYMRSNASTGSYIDFNADL